MISQLKQTQYANLINSILAKLYTLEVSDGKYNKATIDPIQVVDNIDHIQMNALARLLVNRSPLIKEDNVCAAVTIFNGKLLVAFNKGQDQHAQNILQLLQAYIHEPFAENYQKLEEVVCIQMQKAILKLREDTVKLDRMRGAAALKPDETCIQLVNFIMEHNEGNISEYKNWINVILQQPGSSPEARNLAVEVFGPLLDLRTICNDAEQGLLREELEKTISDNNIEFLENKNGKHAEVIISEKIYAQLPKEEPETKPKKCYIGISKLTCGPCYLALKLFDAGEIQIEILGTHGATYPGWQMPNWLLQEEDKLKIFCRNLLSGIPESDRDNELQALSSSLLDEEGQLAFLSEAFVLVQGINIRSTDKYDRVKETTRLDIKFVPEPMLMKYANLKEATVKIMEWDELEKLCEKNTQLFTKIKETKKCISSMKATLQNIGQFSSQATEHISDIYNIYHINSYIQSLSKKETQITEDNLKYIQHVSGIKTQLEQLREGDGSNADKTLRRCKKIMISIFDKESINSLTMSIQNYINFINSQSNPYESHLNSIRTQKSHLEARITLLKQHAELIDKLHSMQKEHEGTAKVDNYQNIKDEHHALKAAYDVISHRPAGSDVNSDESSQKRGGVSVAGS